MKPHEIKATMVLHQVSQQDIATELEVSRQLVSQVVSGTKTSHEVMALIAKRCRRDPRRMWGRRWGAPPGRPRLTCQPS
jgi:predicted XRE-type DNA-binding protein